ncbi:nuclear transport factor 2 family protein [Novosphingobium sp.]|uniref:nuclear transport factor 2 family protein n=1 Tax=Novosphingobium sp. TaxID=1874826 RepID=UPI003B51BF80
MTCISTIGTQTRLDVQELLSHFAHCLDHDRGYDWANLFTYDGVYQCGSAILKGPDELATVPSRIWTLGQGGWRHIITAVAIERTNNPKEIVVRAYCPVMDLNEGNALMAFFDLEFALRSTSQWRISHALATRVGAKGKHYVGGVPIADEPAISLQ